MAEDKFTVIRLLITDPPQGSKFSLLDTPVALPNYCVVCRSGKDDGRKYLDFGFNFDWYGAIYICGLCLSEAVSFLGWIKPEDHAKLVEAYKIAIGKYDELEVENVKLRSGLESLSFLGASTSVNVGDDNLFVKSNDEAASDGESNSTDVDRAEESRKQELIRQNDVSRSEDVQTNESNNEDADEFDLGLDD